MASDMNFHAACRNPDHVHVLWEPSIKGDDPEGKPYFDVSRTGPLDQNIQRAGD